MPVVLRPHLNSCGSYAISVFSCCIVYRPTFVLHDRHTTVVRNSDGGRTTVLRFLDDERVKRRTHRRAERNAAALRDAAKKKTYYALCVTSSHLSLFYNHLKNETSRAPNLIAVVVLVPCFLSYPHFHIPPHQQPRILSNKPLVSVTAFPSIYCMALTTEPAATATQVCAELFLGGGLLKRLRGGGRSYFIPISLLCAYF
jgi:hypothetical protein